MRGARRLDASGCPCDNRCVHLSRREALLSGLVSLLPGHASATEASTDAQARWLAGMAPLPGTDRSSEWSAFAKVEDDRWRVTETRVRAMQRWAATELGPLLPADAAVFYPFSGPDALYALALFGTAARFLLVGLEPVGAMPSFAEPGFFARQAAALADVHRLTFFRTKEMFGGFRRSGVLPALVAIVARLGGRVTGVATLEKPMSARIDWVTAGEKARRLDYVQANLANAGLKSETALVAKLHALAPYVSFLKAAMYLPATARFSYLRRALLDESSVVVQDDTGIAVRDFDATWAMRFYGTYETPVAPYEAYFQPALRDAFARRALGPLPFGIGYHIEAKRSNLLVASRSPGNGAGR